MKPSVQSYKSIAITKQRQHAQLKANRVLKLTFKIAVGSLTRFLKWGIRIFCYHILTKVNKMGCYKIPSTSRKPKTSSVCMFYVILEEGSKLTFGYLCLQTWMKAVKKRCKFNEKEKLVGHHTKTLFFIEQIQFYFNVFTGGKLQEKTLNTIGEWRIVLAYWKILTWFESLIESDLCFY